MLEEVIDICRTEKWPLVAVIVGMDGERLLEIERRLRDHSIPATRVAFRNERPDLYFAVDGHWNSKGHAYVAERLLPIIKGMIQF